MSQIHRTLNPIDFTRIDGVYINELAPPGAIRNQATDGVCVVGEFQRGPVDVVTTVSSSKQFEELFGSVGPDAASAWYKGNLAMRNKTFGNLRVVRVSNGTQALATVNLADGAAADVVQVDAISPGVWGNTLTVDVTAASNGVATDFNLTVNQGSTVLEHFRNVKPTPVAVSGEIVTGSVFVKLTKLAVGDGTVAAVAASALTTGSDGTFADSDYTAAGRGISLLEGIAGDGIKWVFVAERNNDTINADLLAMTVANPTKIAVITGDPAVETTATLAQTDVVDYRSDRVIYCYPPDVQTYVSEANGGEGGLVSVGSNSFVASLCAGIEPGEDPAGPGEQGRKRKLLSGIRELGDITLARTDYILNDEKGIATLNPSPLGGFQLRNGITTSLTPGLETISRRTIADFLQDSIAVFLQTFQNFPITTSNKLLIKGAMEDFLERQQNLGILPKASDLPDGLLPFVVDIESGNTAAQEALGLFIIDLKVRTFASMRYIVLRTQIGQGVEISVDDTTTSQATA